MSLLEILILAAVLWLVREVRQLRRDAGQVEIALADFHIEMRGRLGYVTGLLESRAEVVAVEVGAPSRNGELARLADAPGSVHPEWN